MRILLVEDEPHLRDPLAAQLAAGGHEVVAVGDAAAALTAFRAADGSPDREQAFRVVVCDLTLPGGDGLQLIRRLRDGCPGGDKVAALLITDLATPPVERAAAALGCPLLEKPLCADDLLNRLGSIVEQSLPLDESGDQWSLLPDRGAKLDELTRLKAENRRLRDALELVDADLTATRERLQELEEERADIAAGLAEHRREREGKKKARKKAKGRKTGTATGRAAAQMPPLDAGRAGEPPPFVGASRQLRAVALQIGKLAETTAPLMIAGEKGVGRKLAARLIHDESSRADGPLRYVSGNGDRRGQNAIRRELFGVRFTSKHSPQPGLVDICAAGTLVVEHADRLPIALQYELAVLIERGLIQPVGGDFRQLEMPPRLILLTGPDDGSRALTVELDKQLGPILAIPPLRDRLDDLEPLLRHRWRVTKSPVTDVLTEAWEVLRDHSWRGNAREALQVADEITDLLGGARVVTAPVAIAAIANVGSPAVP